MAATVPGVLLTGVHGSRPSSGVSVGTLYACSTHSLIYQTSDTGSTWATWASLTGTGSTTTIANDTIWAAAGDTVVATGNDAAAVLSKGAAGGHLSIINGAVAWNSGTSFPASKLTGDRYWRTDLGLEFYYDGTRWVTTELFLLVLPNWGQPTTGIAATSTSTLRGSVPPRSGGSDYYFVDQILNYTVGGGTALDASNKWVVTTNKVDSAFAETVIATVNINSGSSAAYRTDTTAINALLGTSSFALQVTATKTGTPGNLFVLMDLTYRIVAT